MKLDDAKSPELEQRALAQAGEIAQAFTEAMIPKYVNGYKEHGGNLYTKGSIEWYLQEVEKEAIDLFVYAYVARKRLKEAVEKFGGGQNG